jgi:DNA-binding response OmpR family regulator
MTAPRRTLASLDAGDSAPTSVVPPSKSENAGRYSMVAAPRAVSKTRQRRSITALVIEADAEVARFAIDILSLSGQAPMHARSLAEARLRLGEGRFDVVLLDLRIDGESSTELLTQLSTSREPPAIVLVSANKRAETIAKEHGGRYVPRTFDVAELTCAIDEALAGRASKRR